MSSVDSLSSVLGSSTPIVDQSREPLSVREGGSAAQKAYNTGLSFEQVLVGQLTQELAQTAGLGDGSDGSSSDDSSSDDSSSDDSSSVFGSDPGASEYAQLLPDALTNSIMSDGGLGLAMPIAQSLDPSLSSPAGVSAATSSSSVTGGVTS
jgi:hypothetical protein